MSLNAKIIAYVVLVLCTAVFAYGFYGTYTKAMESPPARSEPEAVPSTPADPPRETENFTGAMMRYGAGLFVFGIGLALLGAHDISRLIGHRAEQFILADAGEAIKDPEYEQAEKAWADGNHLEAIQMLREQLKRNPKQQYVAIRIAEIYENDLKNYIAAALEYEEVLKHNLAPERWGWAAIHLANLYSGKLNKLDPAEALLRRIVDEYSQTAAAKKARERLGLPEPVALAGTPEPPAATPDAAAPDSHLPPGFRPRKD